MIINTFRRNLLLLNIKIKLSINKIYGVHTPKPAARRLSPAGSVILAYFMQNLSSGKTWRVRKPSRRWRLWFVNTIRSLLV
jgi:hypothetical protein